MPLACLFRARETFWAGTGMICRPLPQESCGPWGEAMLAGAFHGKAGIGELREP